MNLAVQIRQLERWRYGIAFVRGAACVRSVRLPWWQALSRHARRRFRELHVIQSLDGVAQHLREALGHVQLDLGGVGAEIKPVAHVGEHAREHL